MPNILRGMISAPDMQPNAAMNRWIQGILLFDFTLLHIPGTKFPEAQMHCPVET